VNGEWTEPDFIRCTLAQTDESFLLLWFVIEADVVSETNLCLRGADLYQSACYSPEVTPGCPIPNGTFCEAQLPAGYKCINVTK